VTRAQAAVIGAGPAGLMAAEVLAHGGAAVTVYDRMPSAGRKFLLAGRGGLNLTHSEPLERFLGRYGAAEARLRPAMEALPPEALRAWSEGLGQSTFVGSSGRVFPAAFKASPLLRAWLRRLETLGVIFRLRHRWTGWDGEGRLLFESPAGEIAADAGATVLALGGASWPRLGSDGSFADVLLRAGVAVAPLQPANCGFIAGWSDAFRDRFEGQPLKRIALSFGARTQRGEAIVTRDGLEGGAVYALSGPIRDAILAVGEAHVSVDLRPDMTAEKLCERLGKTRGKQSFSNHLRKTIGLTPAAIAFLQEARSSAPVLPSAMAPATLAAFVKSVPVRLIGIAPAARAISTAGGVRFDEVDGQFMLRRWPGAFVAGEMLDWEAPTGGYLLQACFATGAAAAHGALGWLHRDGRADGIPPAST
jgi:uncharacterized flavoprotein (TIGR03862 family)